MSSCYICGEEFSRPDSLSRHLKRKYSCMEVNGVKKSKNDGSISTVTDQFSDDQKHDGKSMLSNNLKRHKLVHRDLLKEKKEQQTEDAARENGEPAMEQVRQDLIKYNEVYLEKIELGRKVAIVIEEGVVCEEALSKEYRQALKLFRKHKPRI